MLTVNYNYFFLQNLKINLKFISKREKTAYNTDKTNVNITTDIDKTNRCQLRFINKN